MARIAPFLEESFEQDRESGRPRGFGYVTFVDSDVAKKVCESKHELDGREVVVIRRPELEQ